MLKNTPKVLFDTDVILDLLLDRVPFSGAAAECFARVESGEVSGHVCATSVTTIHYLAAKTLGRVEGRRLLERVLRLLDVAPVTRTVLETALHAPFTDYEDAVAHEAARHAGIQAIVTRNVRDYKRASLAVHAPLDFLQSLRYG